MEIRDHSRLERWAHNLFKLSEQGEIRFRKEPIELSQSHERVNSPVRAGRDKVQKRTY
jgi:hypothetical protein